jgi:choline dehydrogenase-like flavoprotein
MLSTLIDPWLMYPLAIAQGNLANIRSWPDWQRVMGIMIKIKDEVSGAITPDRISKTATPADRERLAHAENIARQLLTDVGVSSSSVITSSLRGTHPASTARIGTLVDTNLQTELTGLYICDASVFPEALARPTVITIIALGKRLARHLGNARAHSAEPGDKER